MKIIVAGAGEVGFHLAKLLSFESLDITLIDTNRERLRHAETHLDIKTIRGDASSLELIREAGVSQADLFISVTSQEATNIMICSIAKQLGCKRTIARITNIEYINDNSPVNFEKIGVDELISPEELAASEIRQLLVQSAFSNSHVFEGGALTLIGTVLSDSASFIGKTVNEATSIFSVIHFMPIAIQRKGTQYAVIPRGDTIFESGDNVFFITLKEGVEEIHKLTGKVKTPIKRVMILGGGKIGYHTACELSKSKVNVTVVEKNKNKAFEIADLLSDVLVIHGDARDVDLLEEEDLDSMDALISVTENSETNIMSCLMANSRKVKKTIALVENMDYFQLSHSIGIDTLINKKLLSANAIFRYVRRGEIVDMTTLNNLNVEILEFVVKSESKVSGYKIKDLNFLNTAIIGGAIRGGKGVVSLEDYVILPGDRLVVCCLPKSIKKIEHLFGS